eukprot:TRINITY_DN17912_c0_g1_i1.p1 TRINITY_DN17912_c0_g1~~TRINITY_DN17912_c0_g1_i1.p1  ORF type:complete len:432 (-),score=103.78 TRINITY_DN17912_c0_g1_i1:11-1306(-)
MAFSAHKDPAMMVEYEEKEELLNLKAQKMASLIKKSKHFIIFTGAGISTSAGIPDFRGPQGVWTLAATGKKRTEKTVSVLKALPTATHMAVVQLVRSGLCKFVVSQNVDGLHRKSGIPPENLGELHGNTNLEICRTCGKQYIRDYDVSSHSADHKTFRKCSVPNCKGDLYDSIINFGENLPVDVLEKSFMNAEAADLCLVLGSSLTVAPASQIPATVGKSKNGNLVIVNMQKTPLDGVSQMRVFAKTDEFMIAVMKYLGLTIPQWRLQRNLLVGHNYNPSKKECSVWLKGVDTDGTPVSFIKEALFEKGKTSKLIAKEPMIFGPFKPSDQDISWKFTLHFMGFYGEPPLELNIKVDNATENSVRLLTLEYDAFKQEWSAKDNQTLKDIRNQVKEQFFGEIMSKQRRYNASLKDLANAWKILKKFPQDEIVL